MPEKILNVRSHTWLADNLSWANVIYELGNAYDQLGHNFYVVSTNGMNSELFNDKDKMIKSLVALQKFGPGKQAIDIDLTYTVPPNFKDRFLANSKYKCAIYNYETQYWPNSWSDHYHLVDYYFPSSNFSAEIFYMNGVPLEKIFVVPHGVDVAKFNPSVPKVKLKTQKKYKFLSVVAPHHRKCIGTLLNSYCRAFTAKDDVCLVLKTKIYKHSDGLYDISKNPEGRKAFEVCVGDFFQDIYKKYGKNMPEVELIGGRTNNVASLYNACNCHVSTTGSEGFCLPFLESMACGLINISPNYSGHLDFLNENNSLLADVKLRNARPEEQYWHYDKRSTIGQCDEKNFSELMRIVYKNHDELLKKFKPNMEEIIKKFSWINAAQKIIDVADKKIPHYVAGTYDFNKHQVL